jgi:hypothetical protein
VPAQPAAPAVLPAPAAAPAPAPAPAPLPPADAAPTGQEADTDPLAWQRERVAWAERMAKLGYITPGQGEREREVLRVLAESQERVAATQRELEQAEAALAKLRQEFGAGDSDEIMREVRGQVEALRRRLDRRRLAFDRLRLHPDSIRTLDMQRAAVERLEKLRDKGVVSHGELMRARDVLRVLSERQHQIDAVRAELREVEAALEGAGADGRLPEVQRLEARRRALHERLNTELDALDQLGIAPEEHEAAAEPAPSQEESPEQEEPSPQPGPQSFQAPLPIPAPGWPFTFFVGAFW